MLRVPHNRARMCPVRERVIITTMLRTKFLTLLHQGHPGIQQMKSLMRNYMYWPGMDHDIEEMVHVCRPCAAAAKQPFKATLHSWPPATKLWECIHIDFAGPHLGRHFLIVVDAYSKYPEVISAPNTTSWQTVAILHKLCAQHGVPDTIVSDNGKQFTSHEFREFCKANTVSHILSPPYHPQSNGRAEHLADTFKRDLLKLRGEGDVDKILDTFLLAYRMMPSATLPQQRCPAELFFGRKPQTTLDLLLLTKQPTGHDTKMECQFNCQHAAVKRNFDVCYRQSHDWMAGSVAKRIGRRLYDVTLANGLTHRFHANQMWPRSTQLMDDDFTAFADTFNLPVRHPQATNQETSHMDKHADDHNKQSVNQGTPALDDINPEQTSSTLLALRLSKLGHIPKKQFELDPSRKSYKYP